MAVIYYPSDTFLLERTVTSNPSMTEIQLGTNKLAGLNGVGAIGALAYGQSGLVAEGGMSPATRMGVGSTIGVGAAVTGPQLQYTLTGTGKLRLDFSWDIRNIGGGVGSGEGSSYYERYYRSTLTPSPSQPPP